MSPAVQHKSACAGCGTPNFQVAVSQNLSSSCTEYSEVHNISVEQHLEATPADVHYPRGLLRKARLEH